MTICFNSYLKSAARHLSILMLVLITTIAQTGCSTIDDDLSECGTDYRMDYEMRLVTNMTTELQTQLNTVAEANVAKALKQHLSTIFTDVANDISLSFFDTVGDSATKPTSLIKASTVIPSICPNVNMRMWHWPIFRTTDW